jgi:hypothetical protein
MLPALPTLYKRVHTHKVKHSLSLYTSVFWRDWEVVWEWHMDNMNDIHIPQDFRRGEHPWAWYWDSDQIFDVLHTDTKNPSDFLSHFPFSISRNYIMRQLTWCLQTKELEMCTFTPEFLILLNSCDDRNPIFQDFLLRSSRQTPWLWHLHESSHFFINKTGQADFRGHSLVQKLMLNSPLHPPTPSFTPISSYLERTDLSALW